MKLPLCINLLEVPEGMKVTIQFADVSNESVTHNFQFLHSMKTERNIHLPKIVAEARTKAIEDIIQAGIYIAKTLTDKDRTDVQFESLPDNK